MTDLTNPWDIDYSHHRWEVPIKTYHLDLTQDEARIVYNALQLRETHLRNKFESYPEASFYQKNFKLTAELRESVYQQWKGRI